PSGGVGPGRSVGSGVLKETGDRLSQRRGDSVDCVDSRIGVSAVLKSRQSGLIDVCPRRHFCEGQLLPLTLLLEHGENLVELEEFAERDGAGVAALLQRLLQRWSLPLIPF